MISRGTLALIELALETGTPPKKFHWGYMFSPRNGPCFFGWCGLMHGANLRDMSPHDTDTVCRVLDTNSHALPMIEVDTIIRGCGGDSRIAIPQIMMFLRSHVGDQ